MSAFPYGSGYLGPLMVYNTGSDRSVDCELAWSPDIVRWYRILPGVPSIPRGPSGGYDAGCVYGQSGPPVLKNGRLMLFYGGRAVHRATFDKDAEGWRGTDVAEAAGWRPAIHAFTWGETVRHAGRVVVMPLFSTASSSFEIDEFMTETAPE